MKKSRAWVWFVFAGCALSFILGCAALDSFFGVSGTGSTGNTGALSPLPEGSPAAIAKGIAESSGTPWGYVIGWAIAQAGTAYYTIRKAKAGDEAGNEAHKENVSKITDLEAEIHELKKTISYMDALIERLSKPNA